MNVRFAARTRKMLALIVTSSIIGLTLISLLPWISVTETTSSGEAVAVYDFAIMQKSSDDQIKNIASDIDLTITIIWAIIIFSIIAFVGNVILASEKYAALAQLIMMTGCATAIFSIVVVFLQWSLINNIEGANGISIAPIVSQLPIKYAYLPLAVGGLSLLGSILYTISFVTFWLQRFTGSIKQHRTDTTQPDQPKKKRLFSKKKKEAPAQTKKEPAMSPYSGTPMEKAKMPVHDDADIKSEQPQPAELEKTSEPIQHEPILEQPPEPEKETGPFKKEINVRCPQCKHMFTVKKGEGKTKIQCPKCGKEGVVK